MALARPGERDLTRHYEEFFGLRPADLERDRLTILHGRPPDGRVGPAMPFLLRRPTCDERS